MDRTDDMLRCELCKSTFNSFTELKTHIVNEMGIQHDLFCFLDIDLGIRNPGDEKRGVQCTKCLKWFKGEKGLTQHIGKIHKKRRKYATCHLCNGSFPNQYALKFHVQQVHEQIFRIKCPKCEAELYNKYALSKHLANYH